MSKKEEKVEETKKEASTKKTDTKAKTDSLDDLVEDAYQSVMEESVKETKGDKNADKEEKVEAKEKKTEKPKKLSKKEQKELDEATRQAKIKALEEAALSTRSDIDVLAQDDAMEIPISDLPGVGPATTLKLKDAGLTSIRGIALSSVKELVDNADLGDKTAAKLIKLCQEQVGLTFSTADTLYTERLALDRITTGSDNLDELFGDGIETESITELFGEFRTGKTQIAHQLCVTVQLPKERGGLGANAAYIDTEGTFRPERIVEMAERFGLDPKQVLQNITVGRAYTSDHQVNLAKEIATLARGKNIRLVVVDSLTSHFRAEYIGRGTLASRQQNLNQHIHFLLKLAEMHHVAVLVTNQVMSRPDFFFGDPTAPVGGNIVAHSCTTRVYLRKSKQTKRVARIVDSPNLPEVETVFEILSDGIHDG